jgi:hypothetical protein
MDFWSSLLSSLRPDAILTESLKVSMGCNCVPEADWVTLAITMRKLFEPKSTAATNSFEASGELEWFELTSFSFIYL